jgi:chemotaxis protein CheX
MYTHHDMDIEQIAQMTFQSMFFMRLERVNPWATLIPGAITTAVSISGTWTGTVILSLSPDVARATSAMLFHLPPVDVTEADKCEVAAELVNIIGGNLKGVLPSPSSLSLPTVIEGEDLDAYVSGASLVDEIWLDSEAGLVSVRVFCKEER